MKTVITLAVAAIALAGCGVSPSNVGKNEFDPAKIAYFKDDRTGLCFSVVSYNRIDTGGKMGGGMSHAAVPCTPAVERLIRR